MSSRRPWRIYSALALRVREKNVVTYFLYLDLCIQANSALNVYIGRWMNIPRLGNRMSSYYICNPSQLSPYLTFSKTLNPSRWNPAISQIISINQEKFPGHKVKAGCGEEIVISAKCGTLLSTPRWDGYKTIIGTRWERVAMGSWMERRENDKGAHGGCIVETINRWKRRKQ